MGQNFDAFICRQLYITQINTMCVNNEFEGFSGIIDNIRIPWIGNAPINTCMISYPIVVTARNFVTNSLVAEVGRNLSS